MVPRKRTKKELPWAELPLIPGYWCTVCRGIVRRHPGGALCIQGHGGAEEPQPEAKSIHVLRGARVIAASTMEEAFAAALKDPEDMNVDEVAEAINADEMPGIENATATVVDSGKLAVARRLVGSIGPLLGLFPDPEKEITEEEFNASLKPSETQTRTVRVAKGASPEGVARAVAVREKAIAELQAESAPRLAGKARVSFHPLAMTRLAQIELGEGGVVVRSEAVDGALVKLTVALRASEREGFDLGRVVADLKGQGARAVVTAVRPVAEAPAREATRRAAVVLPEAAIADWFAGLSNVPELDRQAACESATAILSADGGSR